MHMTEKMHGAFYKLISAHDLKYRFNGDESQLVSTRQLRGRISVFSYKKIKKHTHSLKTCPKCILVPNNIYPTIPKPCITSEPWNCQQW